MADISLQRAKRIAARINKSYNRCDEYRKGYYFLKYAEEDGHLVPVLEGNDAPLAVDRATGEIIPGFERFDILVSEDFIRTHKVTLR